MDKRLAAYLLGLLTGLLNTGVWVGYLISHETFFFGWGIVLNIFTSLGICIALVNDIWD